jgi:hypothetical protein
MHGIAYGLGANLGTARSALGVERIAEVRDLVKEASAVMLNTGQEAFVARVLLIVCLYLAKLSVVIFSRKVFSGTLNHETMIFAIVYGIVGLGAVGSIISVSAVCHPAHYVFGHKRLACTENVSFSICS